jgi:O-antigen/teichoic acid export membrane protein
MSEQRAFFGVLAMGGAQAARYGLQFAVLPVLARLLDPSAYGLVGLAMPFILLCNLVADMGLGNALVRTPNPSPVLESTVFWICEAACAALVGVVCLLAWPAAKLFAAPGLPPIVIALSPILVLAAALSVPNARIMRERRFAVFAVADTGAGVIAAAAAIAAAASGWGAWSLVAQQLVLWLAKTVWVMSASRFRPRLAFDFAVARPHLSFGLHAAAANVADFIGKSSPALIVGAFLGVQAVGNYSMANQIIRVPDALVSGPVYLAIFAAISARAQDLEAAGRLTMQALRGIAVGIAPMFFGLAVVADLAVKLFLGHKWLGSIEVLVLLTPAGFLICIYSIVVAALLGLGRAAEQFYLTLLTGLFMNAGVFMGARFGAAGAAAGLSAGALLITPAYIWTLARGLKVPARALAGEASAPIGASLVMVAAVLLVRQAIGGWQDWAQLVVSILVGAVAFAAALALFCGRRLLDDLREILPIGARESEIHAVRPPERALDPQI